MRIGLISDTHVPEIAESLPDRVMEVLRGVDLILHAGDLSVVSVLDELQTVAPVLAARGDDDYLIEDDRVDDVQDLTLAGLNLYLIHSSHYWARDLAENPDRHDLARKPDIVVYGHTHRDMVETRNGSLVVNPGSATFPYYQGRANARIIELEERPKG